jgi:hypothetical protein
MRIPIPRIVPENALPQPSADSPHARRSGKLKMSARDAARLLGLSDQRVHQLTQE